MLERTIIVPLLDNDGVPLDNERQAIETALLDILGGFTCDDVHGAWRGDDGKVYRDHSKRYTLAVTPEQDSAILAALPRWCEVLRQQCLYTSARPSDVSFVTPFPVAA